MENGNLALQLELKDYINEGIISFESVREEFDNMVKKEILKRHPNKIWLGTDGKWKTHIPDKSKKSGRDLLRKNSKEELENAIVAFYKGIDEAKKKREENTKVTLRSFFPDYMKYKRLHSKSDATLARMHYYWKRYYENDPIVDIPVIQLSSFQLDEWVHQVVKDNHMKRKEFYNMANIIKLSYTLMKEKNIIPENTYEKVKIETKIFAPSKKKEDKTQVFLTNEKQKIIDELYRRFYNNTTSTAPLGVIFTFETGLRIGELAAVKFSDISNGHIHIQRQEVRTFDVNSSVECHKSGVEVVDYAKTAEGDRHVYLTKEALSILELVKRFNLKNGETNDSWIFIEKNERIHAACFSSRIADSCKAVGMPQKSMHKIRKTFISTLIDGGVNINEVRKQVGHADERTTYGNYCFNRFTEEETCNQIEQALSGKVDKKEDADMLKVPKKDENSCTTVYQKVIAFSDHAKARKPHKISTF